MKIQIHKQTIDTVFFLLILCLPGCIQRDNPWDPHNYQRLPVSECPAESLSAIRHAVAIAVDSATVLVSAPYACSDQWRTDSVLNSATSSRNGTTILNNARKRAHNDSLKQYNKSTIIDSVKMPGYLDTLTSLIVSSVCTTDWNDRTQQVQSITSAIKNRLHLYRSICVSGADSTVALADSLDTAIVMLKSSLDNYVNSVTAATTQARDTNIYTITPYNIAIALENGALRQYIDSLTWLRQTSHTPIIRTADSLSQRLLSVLPGDTLYLSEGSFKPIGGLRITNSGTPQKHILVYGNPLKPSIISDQSGFILSSRSWIDFRNISFSGSGGDGIKMEAGCTGITFTNCTFSDNALNGIEGVESDFELRDCRIMRNSQSGVRFVSSIVSADRLTLQNVLIAGNNLDGIESITAAAVISFSTISDNGRHGINLSASMVHVDIFNTLLTFNGGYGLVRNPMDNQTDMLSLANNDIFGNQSGGTLIDAIYDKGYFSANPLYVNRVNFDYQILSGSRLDSLQRSGVIVGYR